MRKKIIFSLLLTICLIAVPLTRANADGMVNPIFQCDPTMSYVERPAGGGIIGSYYMKFYNTEVAGSVVGTTYCLSPTKPQGTGTFTCAEMINPGQPGENQARDVAFVKAYQELQSRGLTGNSEQGRLIGETVFRWLSFEAYGKGDTDYSKLNSGIYWNYSDSVGHNYSDARFIPRNSIVSKWHPSADVWQNTGDSKVNTAVEIFTAANNAALRILNGETYDALVEDGTIWDLRADIIDVSATEASKYSDSNYEYVVLEIKVKGEQPKQINWESFEVACTNGWVCQVAEAKQNRIVAKIQKNTGSGSYGMKLFTVYYDPRSATSNMMIIKGPNDYFQKMLVVSSGEGIPINRTTGSGGHTPGGRDFPVEGCACNVTTGKFEYSKQVGSTTTSDSCDVSTSSDKCGSFKSKYNCSAPADNPDCLKKPGCRKEGDKCYGPDGTETTCDKYEELCEYKCTDEYENYCPGDGTTPSKDGKTKTSCSEAEWTKMCLCEKDPDNPKCANCNAAVNMVGDCADLTTDNTMTNYTGAISDVNEKDSTGAYIAACRTKNVDKDPIKACVAHFDSQDQAGNKFLSENDCDGTNTDVFRQNPYCKIYCTEQYNFTTPTAQYVGSGGYFTVTTGVGAKRTCYASSGEYESKPINEEKFLQDYEAKLKEIAKYASEYQFAKKGYDAFDTISKPVISACSGGHGEHCSSCHCNAINYKYLYVVSDTPIYDVVREGNNFVLKTVGTNKFDETYGKDNSCRSCGCTCGSSGEPEAKNKRAEFKTNMKANLDALNKAMNEMAKMIADYNSCGGDILEIDNSVLSGFAGITKLLDYETTYTWNKSVSSAWNTTLMFDPTINFSYFSNENYLSGSDKFVRVGDSDQKAYNGVKTYYEGDVNNAYEGSGTPTFGTKNINYLYCDETKCEMRQIPVQKFKWIKSEANTGDSPIQYRSDKNFSTYTPYGTIKQDSADGKSWIELYKEDDESAYPVQLIRETGVYPFKFTYSNIGTFNNGGSACRKDGTTYGRLVSSGTTKSVLTEYNRLTDDQKCNAKGSDSKQTMTQEVGYVCHYIVNCPQCEFKCKKGKCQIVTEDPPVCENNHCKFKCKNCIFSPANSYTFRTVSLTNMFPNSRNVDTNWSITPGETKAKLTLERIQSSKTNDSGEEVYNTPQYSYTLTPNNMAKIREFNNEVGSYLNAKMPNGDDILDCENSGDNVSVRCTSAFLDMLDKDKSYATVNKRVTKDKNAFRLWGLKPEEIPKPGFNSGVGPAWYIEDGD